MPYENACRGIKEYIPLYFDSEENHDLDQLRDFKQLSEIKESIRLIAVLQEFHQKIFKMSPNVFTVLAVEAQGKGDSTTLVQLVGTLFAQFILKGQPSFKEIPEKDLMLFLEKAFDSHGKNNVLRNEPIEEFIDLFSNKTSQKSLSSFLHQVLACVGEDFKRLPRGKSVNPQFISTIKIK